MVIQRRLSFKLPMVQPTPNPEIPHVLGIEQADNQSLHSSHRSNSSHRSSHRSSKDSRRSDVSSAYLREKVKAEAAKVRLMYAEKEALVENEAAEKQAQLKVIKTDRKYTEARARLKVMDDYMNENGSLSKSIVPIEELSAHKKVEHFLDSHESILPTPSCPESWCFLQLHPSCTVYT